MLGFLFSRAYLTNKKKRERKRFSCVHGLWVCRLPTICRGKKRFFFLRRGDYCEYVYGHEDRKKKKSIPNILKMLSFFLPVDSFVASLAASGYTPRPCAFSTIFVSKKKKKKMRKFKKEKEDRVCDYHEISSVYLKKKKEMISRGGELASRSGDARRTRIIKVTTPATN